VKTKIVIISSRFPFPLDKGDKLRIFNQIKYLSITHDIYLIALNTDRKITSKEFDTVIKYCEKIDIITLSKITIIINLIKAFILKKPLQVGFFYSKSAHQKIRKIINQIKPKWVYSQLIRTSEYTKEYEYNIIDYMDSLSKGLERRMKKSPFFLKPIINREFKLTKEYESEIFNHFKKHTIITKNDRKFISHKNNNDIEIIPNGVDTSYYYPMQKITKKYDLIFVGNMNYPPNIEAVEFLCNKILPIIQKTHHNCNVLISGATPHNRVKKLANKQIAIRGWTHDIREIYASGKIFVAPMFIGTGLQNKLLEAMAMGIPCVTTSLANNALLADNSEIIIANNQEDFASSCIKILNSKKISNNLSRKGLEFIKKTYNWDIINNDLKLLFKNEE
jgi:glycosyltransferase involved in cell wall biosynthesis